MNSKHVAVIGAGTMGTALANVIASGGRRVMLWSSDQYTVSEIGENQTHPHYFVGLRLAPNLQPTVNLEAAVCDAAMVVVSVPSGQLRATARALRDCASVDVPILSATKGIEVGTNFRMSQILAAETGSSLVGLISGPNMSYDIMKGLPTAIVVAAESLTVRQAAIRYLSTRGLRVFVDSDPTGVEIAGALKNIVAIAVGIAGGLELGDNFRAMLFSLGLREIQILTKRLGGRAADVNGLACVGDLFLTTTSEFSRNHMVGVLVGKGASVPEVRARLATLRETAEGLNTVEGYRALVGVSGPHMPLAEAVYEIIVEGRDPRCTLTTLFEGPLLAYEVPEAGETCDLEGR